MKKTRHLALILFTFLLMLSSVQLYYDHDTVKAGYGSGWTYFKNLYLSNKYLGYQQLIIVGKSSGGNVSCGGHCKDDFSDVRFVHDNTTMLNYWMQNYTSGVRATFWVNNSYNDSCIRMYYGNSGGVYMGNGTLTFLLFDDFAGTSLNASKWHTIGAPNPAFHNSEMYISTLGIFKYISSYKTFTQNTSISARSHYKAGERGETIAFSINPSYPYNSPPAFCFGAGGAAVMYFTWCNGLGNLGSSTTAITAVYKIYTLDRSGASRIIGKINGTILGSADSSTNTPRTAMNVSIGKGAGTEQSNITVDWIFVSTIRATKQGWASFSIEYFNNDAPINSNASPILGTIIISPPTLTVTISDRHGNYMNQTFRSNYTGTWTNLQFNNHTLNATLYVYNLPFNKNVTIWWSSNLTDNHSHWSNNTYNFYYIRVPSINLTIIGHHVNTTHTNQTSYNFLTGWKYYDNDSGNITALHVINSTDHAVPLHVIVFNSTGWWFTDLDFCHAGYTPILTNCTGSTYFTWIPGYGYSFVDQYTGVLTPLHLINTSSGVTGYIAQSQNSTGYWIEIHLIGTGGGPGAIYKVKINLSNIMNFKNWSGSISSTSENISFNVTNNMSVVCNGNTTISITITMIHLSMIVLLIMTIFFLFMGYSMSDRKEGAWFLIFGSFMLFSLMMAVIIVFSGVWWFTSPVFILIVVIVIRDGILLLIHGKKYRRE